MSIDPMPITRYRQLIQPSTNKRPSKHQSESMSVENVSSLRGFHLSTHNLLPYPSIASNYDSYLASQRFSVDPDSAPPLSI